MNIGTWATSANCRREQCDTPAESGVNPRFGITDVAEKHFLGQLVPVDGTQKEKIARARGLEVPDLAYTSTISVIMKMTTEDKNALFDQKAYLFRDRWYFPLAIVSLFAFVKI
ncbi:hypothetical protein EON65_01495 [archaeon]|nr:MAG: hypothetical protein EON65_01495 [archaeon]